MLPMLSLLAPLVSPLIKNALGVFGNIGNMQAAGNMTKISINNINNIINNISNNNNNNNNKINY